jgi:hypothetical protein
MCPACLAAIALLVAKAATTTGLTALETREGRSTLARIAVSDSSDRSLLEGFACVVVQAF